MELVDFRVYGLDCGCGIFFGLVGHFRLFAIATRTVHVRTVVLPGVVPLGAIGALGIGLFFLGLLYSGALGFGLGVFAGLVRFLFFLGVPACLIC